jgi:ribosome-associated protein
MSDEFEYDEYAEDESAAPSKSQIKRDMDALQDLGLKLTTLRPDQLDEFSISSQLRQAIDQYNKLKANEARRRQRQFIGKLMRHENADEIRQILDRFDAGSIELTQTLHQLENWRDQLLGDDNHCVTAFVEEYPDTDVQTLRQLIRNTRKDKENNKNTGQYKKLFRFIRDTHDAHRQT